MIGRKYYYHITVANNWGKEKILIPRIFGINRCDREPEVARICVSPTIEGCLVALGVCLNGYKNIFVYRTKYPIKGRKCFGVVDSHITGERWITRPTKFIKYGTLDKKQLPKDLFTLPIGNVSDVVFQNKMFEKLEKLNLNYLKRN